jgi:hypothetical protein
MLLEQTTCVFFDDGIEVLACRCEAVERVGPQSWWVACARCEGQDGE